MFPTARQNAVPTPPPTPEQLAAALYASSDLICSIDSEGRFTSWNAGCERLYGWTAEEVLGQRVELYVPESERDQLDLIVRALRNGEDVPPVETVRLTRDRRAVNVSLRVSPVRDEVGRVIGGLSVGRDITLEVTCRQELEESRNHLRARLDTSAVAQATLTPEGRYSYVNDAYCRLAGRSRDAMLGRDVADSCVGVGRQEIALLRQVSRGERDVTAERRTLRRPDGSAAEVVVHASAIRSADGEVSGVALTLQDVTDLLETQARLSTLQARWEALSRQTADVGFLAEPDGTLTFVSEALSERFGYSPQQVVGRQGWDFFHPDDLDAARLAWDRVATRELERTTFEARVRRADGTWVWISETVLDLRSDPHVRSIVATVRDISERKAAEQRLGELSDHDPLTGVANRAVLLERATQAGSRHRPPGQGWGLLLLGLDDFTHVNDELGHAAGDEILRGLSHLLSAVLGPLDTLARVDGDRFAVVVDGVSDEQDLHERADDLQALLAVGVSGAGRHVQLTTSVGAVLGRQGDAAAVLASAEAALRTAKSRGPESVEVYTDQARTVDRQRREAVADLRRGLAAGEFVLHYQPVIELSSGVPVGVEALVRWEHPSRGLLAPDAFLDLAEETGLILQLGDVLLREACLAAVSWPEVAGRQLSVAVNLSLRQIAEPGVVDLVEQAVTQARLDPARLMLEVTETAFTRNLAAVTETLVALRRFGLGVAMDDFGTGYSSLAYLRRFPVTAIKIDRSFVTGLGVDSDDGAIVDSVITLAKAVGIDCIAEGVETRDQLDQLLALGCGHAQGYLWSRPLSEEGLLAWLHSRPAAVVAPDRPAAERGVVADAEDLVLRRIRDLLDGGASLNTIAAALNVEGGLSPSGVRWHARSVARVIDGSRRQPVE